MAALIYISANSVQKGFLCSISLPGLVICMILRHFKGEYLKSILLVYSLFKQAITCPKILMINKITRTFINLN
jgi:hypothetical protein